MLFALNSYEAASIQIFKNNDDLQDEGENAAIDTLRRPPGGGGGSIPDDAHHFKINLFLMLIALIISILK
jgi:hypothetical protein